MAKGKSTWKYNKLLTARRNYYAFGTSNKSNPMGIDITSNAYHGYRGDAKATAAFVKSANENGAKIDTNNLPGSLGGGKIDGGQGGNTSQGGLFGAIGSIGMQAASDIAGMINNINANDVKEKAASLAKGINARQMKPQSVDDTFDSLASDIASTSQLNHVTAKQLGAKNFGQGFGEAFVAGNKGFASGAGLGAIGAVASAIGSTVTSIIGNVARNKKAKKEANRLNSLIDYTNNFNERSILNRAENLGVNQSSNLEANYSAFGGPLGFGDGAIGYDFMNRYISAKESQAQGKDKSIASMPNSFAFGGGTHGANFTNGLMSIDNGGSHETNPFEGVPMGVDNEGTPNLVEEGETIFNDYVFSKRLTVPQAVRNKYKLRGTKNISFAEASKQMAKESEERPNDPISQRGLQALMSDLAMAQEQLKSNNQKGMFAYGGKVNKYDGISSPTQQMNYDWDPFLTALSGYTTSRQKGNNSGKYMPDPYLPMEGNPYMLGATDITGLESNDEYKAFTESMIANPNMDYLRALDAGVASGVPRLIGKDGNLVYNWADLFRGRRNDQIGGIYHWTPTMSSTVSAAPEGTGSPAQTPETAKEPPTNVTKTKGKKYLYKGTDGKYVEYTGENAPVYMRNNGYFSSSTSSDDDFDYYFYDPEEEMGQGKYAEWLRYAPAVGFGIGAITDSLGLTNKPDYSNADAILEATKSGGNYQPVEFNPIGNYLAYTPFDRDYYINKMNAEAGATRRALLQNASMNRGAGMAAILAADNNAQNQLGQLARQAEEYNLAQRQQVEDFNRNTNITNSQGFLQADIANQKAQSEMRDFSMKGTLAAAQMRESARQASDAARSANISGLFQTLGDIGFEERNARMRDWAIRHGVFGPGTEDYGRTKKAKGGKIKRKKGLTF